MIIEINEREAILLVGACHNRYMEYKYGQATKTRDRENAEHISKEYQSLYRKIKEIIEENNK